MTELLRARNVTSASCRRVFGMVAAAAVAAAMVAACGNSETAQQVKDARDAAGRTASAGEYRPSEKLMQDVESTTDWDKLSSDIKSKGSAADYLQKNPPEKDLADAVTKAQAASQAATDPALKSALLAQLASTQLQLSNVRFVNLESMLQQVTDQAVEIERLSQAVIDEAGRAKVLQAVADAKPSNDRLAKAQRALADAQKAVEEKQKQVQELESQLSDKQARARKIYADTDAAFQAAGAKSGKESIDAGNKAMADRRQADELMAEISNISPSLLQARGELDLAKDQLTSAQSTQKVEEETYSAALKASQQAAEQAGKLRDSAKTLVDEDGINQRLKKLADLSAGIDAATKKAAEAADQAAQSYTLAWNAYNQYSSSINDKAQAGGVAADDPLVKGVKDNRMQALLAWSRAAAHQQSGRISFAAYHAATLLAEANKQAAAAQDRIGEKGTPTSGLNATAYKTAAEQAFGKAIAAAQEGTRLPGSLVDPIKWLGYSLEAQAQHGLYLTGNEGALKAAQAARDNAVKSNPAAADQLQMIAGS